MTGVNDLSEVHDVDVVVHPGKQQLSDAIADHLGEGLPLIGRGEPLSAAREALHDEGAVLVVDGGRPIGVLTRFDLLEALAN